MSKFNGALIFFILIFKLYVISLSSLGRLGIELNKEEKSILALIENKYVLKTNSENFQKSL